MAAGQTSLFAPYIYVLPLKDMTWRRFPFPSIPNRAWTLARTNVGSRLIEFGAASQRFHYEYDVTEVLQATLQSLEGFSQEESLGVLEAEVPTTLEEAAKALHVPVSPAFEFSQQPRRRVSNTAFDTNIGCVLDALGAQTPLSQLLPGTRLNLLTAMGRYNCISSLHSLGHGFPWIHPTPLLPMGYVVQRMARSLRCTQCLPTRCYFTLTAFTCAACASLDWSPFPAFKAPQQPYCGCLCIA